MCTSSDYKTTGRNRDPNSSAKTVPRPVDANYPQEIHACTKWNPVNVIGRLNLYRRLAKGERIIVVPAQITPLRTMEDHYTREGYEIWKCEEGYRSRNPEHTTTVVRHLNLTFVSVFFALFLLVPRVTSNTSEEVVYGGAVWEESTKTTFDISDLSLFSNGTRKLMPAVVSTDSGSGNATITVTSYELASYNRRDTDDRRLVEQPVAPPGCCRFRYFGRCYSQVSNRRSRRRRRAAQTWRWVDTAGTQAMSGSFSSKTGFLEDIEVCNVQFAVISTTFTCEKGLRPRASLTWEWRFAGSGGGTFESGDTEDEDTDRVERDDTRVCAAT